MTFYVSNEPECLFFIFEYTTIFVVSRFYHFDEISLMNRIVFLHQKLINSLMEIICNYKFLRMSYKLNKKKEMSEKVKTRLVAIIPWVIVVMLFVITALSFLDRQLLSISILRIKQDIVITDEDYSWITNGFIVGYAIMITLGGIFIDKFGTKLGLALSLGIWTIASGLHSIANTVEHFILFRFLLGIGEGACFPGAIKAVIEWVPEKRRSLGVGIAIGGSAIGAVVAPLLCMFLLDEIGWRLIFLISPIISICWLGLWLFLNNKKNSAYKQSIAINIVTDGILKSINKYSFNTILKNKTVWVFIAMRMLFDPIILNLKSKSH